MVILAAVNRSQNVTAKWRRIDIVKKVQTFNDVVIFPQGSSSFVFAGVVTQFANDDTLGGRFQGQGHHNPLNILPF